MTNHCPLCDSVVDNHCLQCDKCNDWIHNGCSKFPPYMIIQINQGFHMQLLCKNKISVVFL